MSGDAQVLTAFATAGASTTADSGPRWRPIWKPKEHVETSYEHRTNTVLYMINPILWGLNWITFCYHFFLMAFFSNNRIFWDSGQQILWHFWAYVNLGEKARKYTICIHEKSIVRAFHHLYTLGSRTQKTWNSWQKQSMAQPGEAKWTRLWSKRKQIKSRPFFGVRLCVWMDGWLVVCLWLLLLLFQPSSCQHQKFRGSHQENMETFQQKLPLLARWNPKCSPKISKD